MQKTCANGHQFFKTSDCPICPTCEKERVPESDFLKVLGAPARRALENAGITSLEKLTEKSEKDLLKLHGFGPSSIPKLVKFLETKGLSLNN